MAQFERQAGELLVKEGVKTRFPPFSIFLIEGGAEVNAKADVARRLRARSFLERPFFIPVGVGSAAPEGVPGH